MTQTTSKKFFIAAATALFAMSLASQAYAFCFSNDSLSNTSFWVRQMPEDAFKKTAAKTAEFSKCNVLPKKQKEKCLELKKKARSKTDQALIDFYDFVTGLPVVGDPVDKAAKYSKRKLFEYAKWQYKVIKKTEKFIDDVLAPLSTRFKQTVQPDDTKCCSYKDRDCNPSGKQDAKIYFNIKYAGISRIVQIGATDHMECRIDKRNAQGAACTDYVWPYSPYRAHKKTSRGMLIKSLFDGKCLDVWGSKKNNGANVGLWKCHGGKNQRWTVYRDGIIKSEMNGKCLDVNGATKMGKNGANVQLWDCHGGLNQLWRYGPNDTITSNASGRYAWCLDVKDWNKKNGANAQIWKCGNKQANQRWRATRDVTFTEALQVRYPGKCLDNTGSKKKGVVVHSWTCNKKNVNQKWQFKKLSGGYYQIKSRRSGLCLDVIGGKRNNGVKVIQWSCHGSGNQQWKPHNVGGGWFQLKNRNSGKCLDLTGPYRKNGTPFQQWACKNVKNQMFREFK